MRDISIRMETEHALRDANEQLSHRVEEIEELQATLREQAIRDALSGLFNRRFLEETCTRELARAQREGYPVALAMFDLDLFKRINDTYGHAAGDEVIVALARLLQQHARSSDTACRFGGEEFVLLLPGVDLETAAARVEELRRTFAEPGDHLRRLSPARERFGGRRCLSGARPHDPRAHCPRRRGALRGEARRAQPGRILERRHAAVALTPRQRKKQNRARGPVSSVLQVPAIAGTLA